MRSKTVIDGTAGKITVKRVPWSSAFARITVEGEAIWLSPKKLLEFGQACVQIAKELREKKREENK